MMASTSSRKPVAAVTLDIDWAPDFVIDRVAQMLLERGVKCTWFVTHESAAVDRLREHPELFELGIHPNFLPGSTQGATAAEVMAFCRRCVPEARSMRTHSLVQSSVLLNTVVAEGWIKRDASLFLPYHAGLRPVLYRSGGREMWRIPYFWEDDVEMEQAEPNWDLTSLLSGSGLAVFDFHPIHVYLNAATCETYQQMKRAVGKFAQATESEVARFIQAGAGAGSAFAGLLRCLSESSWQAVTIGEVPLPESACAGKGAAA